jgi:hypothetical protein
MLDTDRRLASSGPRGTEPLRVGRASPHDTPAEPVVLFAALFVALVMFLVATWLGH